MLENLEKKGAVSNVKAYTIAPKSNKMKTTLARIPYYEQQNCYTYITRACTYEHTFRSSNSNARGKDSSIIICHSIYQISVI